MRLIDIEKTMRQIAATHLELKRELKKAASKPQLLDKVAQEAATIVVRRTRLGFGARDGKKEKLKKLSEGYIKQRKRSTELSPFTSPRKSNLTFTGQMLESVHAQGHTVRIPKGRNSRVATYVTEQGRPWFGVTEQERAQLKIFYERLVGRFKHIR